MSRPGHGSMRIMREGGLISMRDRVAPFWLLGFFLLAGGILGMAMPLGLANNAGSLEPWERTISFVVGLGVSAGGLWWLALNPATVLQLDLTRRTLTLIRWGILGRRVRQLRIEHLEGVELEQGKDSDGDPIWRPLMRLRGGETLRLSELWEHDESGVRTSLAALAESCGLPQPAAARLSRDDTTA